MSSRGIFGFLVGILVVGGLVALGINVYEAGVAQGVIDAGRFPAGATVPVQGYGYHDGPGIFGLLFGLFFLFLIFGLLRAAFGRGRGWGHGYGHGYGPGWGKGFGPDGDPGSWREERDRRVADWHRKLHEEEGGQPGSGSSGGSAAR